MSQPKAIKKIAKRIKKIKLCLSDDHFKKREKVECLEDTLKKLKESQKALKKQLDDKKDDELEERLEVVKAQREKGLKLLKKMRAELK
jgi:hypothetical protein